MLKTAVLKQSKHPYISINPKISKGSPVILGTRLRVIDIAIEYDRLGLMPDQIIDAHPHLTLEALHDALSYYYENQTVIDNEIRQRKENIRRLSNKFPSKLKKSIG
ncbi:MAG: DUF433 domain-containing protein [Nitrospirae bacterium]|nr:DUF433 domain-containing protein [Nitrospirota bacterium]